MNKQDIKNIEIIDKLVEKFMGYDNESLAHFKQELYTPSIDEEYLKIIGEDRRITWKIGDDISIEENQTVSTRVYNIFADSFHTFACHSCANNKKVIFITPGNVMNNIMIVDKNEVKIKKYLFKKCLGVDILNQDLIDNYDFTTIKKYVSLIDTKNIMKSTDNQYKEQVLKVEIVQKLINEMGFINMYDRQTRIKSDELLSRIEKLDVFNDDKASRILFNCRSIKNKFDSIKSFLGCANSILEQYSLKIQSQRYKENSKEFYCYELINSKGREHIDELLQYRIDNGFNIECCIRKYSPTTHYKDLIKIKPPMVIDDDDEKVIHFKNY